MMDAKLSRRKTVLYFLTAVILTGIAVRIFVFDSFTVVGNSMSPTIQEGDHVFVNKLAYRFKDPSRGDIVVGDFRGLEGKKAIKRIAAVPGEWISVKDGVVMVSPHREEDQVEVTKIGSGRIKQGSSTPVVHKLDPYEYFLSGDNEISSIDSFELGPVDIYRLDGQVIGMFRLRDLTYTGF